MSIHGAQEEMAGAGGGNEAASAGEAVVRERNPDPAEVESRAGTQDQKPSNLETRISRQWVEQVCGFFLKGMEEARRNGQMLPLTIEHKELPQNHSPHPWMTVKGPLMEVCLISFNGRPNEARRRQKLGNVTSEFKSI